MSSVSNAAGAPEAAATRRPRTDLLAPKQEIPRPAYLTASAITATTVIGLWCLLSYGGLVRSDFLPAPDVVAATGARMIADGSLLGHMATSVGVIFSGFFLASILAIPLGIMMGSFRLVEAVVEPITNFMRYLPVTALIPLLILWIGIGIEQKIAVIFLGTFFQQIILISDVSRRVPKDLIDSAYTLGATRKQAVLRVLLPATYPGVMDTLRVTMGWAWTYLVVAELVAAQSGLGYMILQAMRGLFTDVIFLGILTIGLLGLASDQALKALRNRLLPWARER